MYFLCAFLPMLLLFLLFIYDTYIVYAAHIIYTAENIPEVQLDFFSWRFSTKFDLLFSYFDKNLHPNYYIDTIKNIFELLTKGQITIIHNKEENCLLCQMSEVWNNATYESFKQVVFIDCNCKKIIISFFYVLFSW